MSDYRSPDEVYQELRKVYYEIMDTDNELDEYADTLTGADELDYELIAPVLQRKHELSIKLLELTNEHKRVKQLSKDRYSKEKNTWAKE